MYMCIIKKQYVNLTRKCVEEKMPSWCEHLREMDGKQVRDKIPTVLVVNRRRNLVKFLVIDAKARVQIICPLLTKLREGNF